MDNQIAARISELESLLEITYCHKLKCKLPHPHQILPSYVENRIRALKQEADKMKWSNA